jgi:hypothetical protein
MPMTSKQLRKQINIIDEQLSNYKTSLRNDLDKFSSWTRVNLHKPEIILLIIIGLYVTQNIWKKGLSSFIKSMVLSKIL